MSIRLEAGAGERIAGKHTDAGTTIQESATAAPSGVDAGLGTPELLSILTAVSETADGLAKIQGVLGQQVLEAARNIDRTDTEVASMFASLNKVLE